MRCTSFLAAVSCVALVAACASIYGVTDVPNPSDGGGPDGLATGPDGSTGSDGEATSDGGSDGTVGDTSTGHGDSSADGPGVDAGGCVIGGKSYPAGAVDPSSQCLFCQPATSQTTWSSTNGASCGGTAGGTCASGACVMPASCAPSGAGMTDCGDGGESCCTSLVVDGGTYDRTYTNGGSGPTQEADPASVSSFRLDKYEVTVGRFRQFVTAVNGGLVTINGSGKHSYLNGGKGLANLDGTGGYEGGWYSGDNTYIQPTDANLECATPWQTWTSAPGGNETLPIVCDTWQEAYAFCIWDGGFLPSEAEWEYAAAGGSTQAQYPWGTAAPGQNNQYAIYDCNYPGGTGGACGGSTENIAPVGTASAGKGFFGQYDLAGNVEEWSLDWYGPYVSPCVDGAYLTYMSGSSRQFRGGCFSSDISELAPAYRYQGQNGRSWSVGIRCARTP